MSPFAKQLLANLFMVAGVAPLFLCVWYWERKNQSRSTPLTKDLLRSPGYSLRQEINDRNFDLLGYFLVGLMAPLLLYIAFVTTEDGLHSKVIAGIALGVVFIGFEVFIVRKMNVLLDARRNLMIGMEGELAVGEELNQLMLEGCRVFHDVPTDYGNIDHVVISPSGVYAVNTKMVTKNAEKAEGAEVVVDHTRNVIRFPGFDYPIDTDAFETEARWLAQFLASSVGQAVKVESMLALPGWFIKDRIGRGPVYVFNPVRPKRFFLHNHRALSDQMQQQIAHQLDQRCRTVERSFPNKRKWKTS